MTNRRSAGTTAFTLIELMMVVAVIAILAAILVPVIGNARLSTQIAYSSTSLRQLVVANFAHAADNRGALAMATNEENDKRWSAAQVNGEWDRSRGYLSPYLDKNEQAAYCPILAGLSNLDNPSFELNTGGFGYNSAYLGGVEGKFTGRPSAKIHSIRNPSRTLMFATSAYARAEGIQEYPFVEPPFRDFGSVSSQRPSPTLHFRARGRAIVAWADGHVSLEAPKERPHGHNPHSGDSEAKALGWIGPDDNNGYWNPAN